MCSKSQGFYGDQPDLSYDRVATRLELFRIENQIHNYSVVEMTKNGQVCVDEDTKEPYIIYDKVRYDLEPEYEQVIDG